MKPKIVKTPHYKQQMKYRALDKARAEEEDNTIARAIIQCTALVMAMAGMSSIMAISYPDRPARTDSALPVVEGVDVGGDDLGYYPPDYEPEAIPVPPMRPVWRVENDEFNEQLEEALR